MNPPSLASRSWPDSSSGPGAAPGALIGSNLRSAYFCAVAFLLGLLHPWSISLVGQLPVGELVILALLGQTLLWIVMTSRLPQIPSPRVICFFSLAQVIALLSYIASDLYRESLPIDMIRGWVRMFFLLADLLGFAILFGAEPRVLAWRQFGFGLSFLQVFVVPPLFDDYWKFGFGMPLTVLVVLAAPYFGGCVGTLVALVIAGGVHTALAFRSAGAACWVIAGLLALRYLPSQLRKVVLVTGLAALLVASPRIVAHTFTSKSARANPSNIERGAMLQAAWEGFISSPLIGQGSWFSKSNVTDNFVLIRHEGAQENHGTIGFEETDVEAVSIHSQLLSAMAEGGIFGATFFFFYGLALLWGIWHSLVVAPWSWLVPTRLFLFVMYFWDLLMSPFSGPVRLNIGLATVLVAMCVRESRQASVAAAFRSNPVPAS